MSEPEKTPLYDLHCAQGGKLTAFAGALLPLSYAGGGLLAEHVHTRAAASLFDVSHMGQARVTAQSAEAMDAATAALERITPAALSTLQPGQSKYAVLTNARGGVVDDCIFTRMDDADGGGWFIVFNAARKAVDVQLFEDALANCGADFVLMKEQALLAVQGPAAVEVVGAAFPQARELRFMQGAAMDSDFGRCQVNRCGYTGEDGFEISLPAAQAEALAKIFLATGGGAVCKMAGLGARDSLRIEAGLCLYGNELSEEISPIEANLLWTIPKSRRGADAPYAGAAAIAAQISGGAPRRLTALLPQSKTPVRSGALLTHAGQQVGAVTSGVHSPTLGVPVALALVQAAVPADAELTAEVRGKQITCVQTTPPFVPHNYYRG